MKTPTATVPLLLALGACQLSTASPNLYLCGDGGDCSEIAGTECCWDGYCHFQDVGCPPQTTTGTSGFGNSSGGSTTRSSTSAGSTGHASSTGAAPSSGSGGGTTGGSSSSASSGVGSSGAGTTVGASSSTSNGSSGSNGGSTTGGGTTGAASSGGSSTGSTAALGQFCSSGTECASGSCCEDSSTCGMANDDNGLDTCCQPTWASSASQEPCCSGNPASATVCSPGPLFTGGACTDDCQCVGVCSGTPSAPGTCGPGGGDCLAQVGMSCTSDEMCSFSSLTGTAYVCQGPAGHQVCCVGSGFGCADSAVCCSGVCDLTNDVCKGEYAATAFPDGGPRCAGSGVACEEDGECCSGLYCNGGTCGTGTDSCGTTERVGHTCTTDTECCVTMPYLDANVCEGPPGHQVCCVASGNFCGDSSECCHGYCDTTNGLNACN